MPRPRKYVARKVCSSIAAGRDRRSLTLPDMQINQQGTKPIAALCMSVHFVREASGRAVLGTKCQPSYERWRGRRLD